MWPLIDYSALIGGNSICEKNPFQHLLSSLNAVISTNERSWIYKGSHDLEAGLTFILQMIITLVL